MHVATHVEIDAARQVWFPMYWETFPNSGSIGYPITDFVINLRITESSAENGAKFQTVLNILSLYENVSRELTSSRFGLSACRFR